MKLMKKVVIVGAVFLSFGSTVAFGTCPNTPVADTKVDATKNIAEEGNGKPKPVTNSGGGDTQQTTNQ